MGSISQFPKSLSFAKYDRNKRQPATSGPDHLLTQTAVHLKLCVSTTALKYPVALAIGAGRHCGLGVFAREWMARSSQSDADHMRRELQRRSGRHSTVAGASPKHSDCAFATLCTVLSHWVGQATSGSGCSRPRVEIGLWHLGVWGLGRKCMMMGQLGDGGYDHEASNPGRRPGRACRAPDIERPLNLRPSSADTE